MAKHFELTFEQAAFDQVFDDISYPARFVDDRESFDESAFGPFRYGNSPRVAAPLATNTDLFQWADSNAETPLGEQILDFKDSLADRLALVQQSKAEAKNCGEIWEGPPESELDPLKPLSDWDAQFHLAWIRVDIKTRPQLSLASPRSTLNRIRVEVSATGELWVKHPWPKCVKRCNKPFDGLCCKWKKITKWTRVASGTIRDLDLYADAALEFGVNEAKSIVAVPAFTKFRIDEDIFRSIPLEGLVNYFLRKQRTILEIVKAADLELDFKELGLTYWPQSILLPAATGKLVAQVELSRK